LPKVVVNKDTETNFIIIYIYIYWSTDWCNC